MVGIKSENTNDKFWREIDIYLVQISETIQQTYNISSCVVHVTKKI